MSGVWILGAQAFVEKIDDSGPLDRDEMHAIAVHFRSGLPMSM